MEKKLGERLVEAGLVTADAIDKALQQQKITGHRLGDCLVEIGLIGETTLLRFLAAELNTRFVSADKLSKVKIPTEVLDKVPVRMAEAQGFIPIAYDPEEKLLSVVMGEPQNADLVKEIQLVTESSQVVPYIGLRAAITATIRKHYYGDPTAFAQLAQGALRSDTAAAAASGEGSDLRSAPGLSFETNARSVIARPGTQISGPTQLREALGSIRGGALGENDFIETLNVLVGLLEFPRQDMRAHSAQLARQASTIGRRLGLPPRDISHIAIAAYLHDLGKPSKTHFTLANNFQVPEWKADAKRYCRAPVKLFESVHLPVQVNAMLAQVYEAYDGSGTPQGTRGEDIAAGARILAAVDSFLDLTKNPNNAFKRRLSRAEALQLLHDQSGKLFDPNVVDMIDRVNSGEFLRQRIASDGRQVLVVEPDEATRIDLVEELNRRGLVTHSVATLDGVIDAMLRGDADFLVIGIRFGAGDVSAIIQYLRTRPETAGVPVVVLGEPTEPGVRERLGQAGVSGLLGLPLDPPAAAGQIESLYRAHVDNGAPARLVPGSFDEIAPAALIDLFASGRKTGKLTVTVNGKEGWLFFERGQAVFASYDGKSGEGGVKALIDLTSGDFVYDPNAVLAEMPQMESPFEVFLKKGGAVRSGAAS